MQDELILTTNKIAFLPTAIFNTERNDTLKSYFWIEKKEKIKAQIKESFTSHPNEKAEFDIILKFDMGSLRL